MRFLGMVTVDSDLPMKISNDSARSLVKDESDVLGRDFKVIVGLAGCLLRRSLYHVEGLPGI